MSTDREVNRMVVRGRRAVECPACCAMPFPGALHTTYCPNYVEPEKAPKPPKRKAKTSAHHR